MLRATNLNATKNMTPGGVGEPNLGTEEVEFWTVEIRIRGVESESNKNPKSWIFDEGLSKNGSNLDKILEGFMWVRIGNWIKEGELIGYEGGCIGSEANGNWNGD